MRKIKLFLVVSLLTIIAFSSCEDNNTVDPNAEGELTFSFTSNQSGLKKAFESTEPTSLLVSIKNSSGEYVFTNEIIKLFKMNNEYISSPMTLIVGDYELTDFMVIDDNNNVLYASPKEGSVKAYLVNNPLSIEYTIDEDDVKKVTPEVISTENISPEDFGYGTFSFDVIETINFLTTVFVYNESIQNFELTDAGVLIKNNSDILFNGTLDAVTNLITVNSAYDHYSITISKSGYKDYTETFTNDSISKHFSKPLTVILEKESIKLVLQPNAIDGKDAIISKIVPDNNYGSLEDINVYAWTQDGILNVNRFAIDFDLTALAIDAEIDSAFISFYFNNTSVYASEHSGDNSFVIKRITSDWDEATITWNSQPSTSSVNQINFAGSSTPTQDFTNLNITELIQDIVNDKENSYGMLFYLQVESAYKRLILASSDHPNENLRPKLEIYYTESK